MFFEEGIQGGAERFKNVFIILNINHIISGVSHEPQKWNIPYPIITGT